MKESPKERFLGKAELATHKHPDTKKETRALGYFANNDDAITPLTGSDIPAWARDFRNEKVSGTGTSIYIPYPDFKDKHFEEITLSLISNFYMAFKEKLLEVDVRDLCIDSRAIERPHYNFLDPILISPQEARGRI